jgi:DNA-binding NarL/FixJ family response regulator
VVEDCYVEAQALARLLESSGLEVVGPVGRLDQAISIAADRELDGALLDIDLGGVLAAVKNAIETAPPR